MKSIMEVVHLSKTIPDFQTHYFFFIVKIGFEKSFFLEFQVPDATSIHKIQTIPLKISILMIKSS